MALIHPRTSEIEATFGSAALVELVMKTSTEVMNSPGASSKIPVDGISVGGRQAARTENENQGKHQRMELVGGVIRVMKGVLLFADNTEGGCVFMK